MDELYIEKVLNGDIDAYKYFVRQYKDMAFTLAVSVLKSEFDAKDAVQEAFIIAFRKLRSFKGDSKFSTWFCRIVINEALKQVKKRDKDPYEFRDMPDVPLEDIPHSLVSMKEEQQKYFIDLALQKIPSKEALALNLFYLQEYSVEEVSDLTGWSVSNVKVILHRARKRMYFELSKISKTEKKLLY